MRLLTTFFLWISLFLPVFVFEEMYRFQFVLEELGSGVYSDAPIYIFFSLVLTFIYFFLTPRLFKYWWYQLLFTLLYLVFYIFMCTSATSAYKSGTTWLFEEVFLELVKPHSYFYIIGIIGVISHYFFQRLIAFKPTKIFMKRFIYAILLLCSIAIFTIEPLAIAFGNKFSMLHKNGYFIPKQSNIYKFQETKSDHGSGEYWLYGEDDTYYYSTMACKNYPYSVVAKEDVKNLHDFNSLDYKTWKHCHYSQIHAQTTEEFIPKGYKLFEQNRADITINKEKQTVTTLVIKDTKKGLQEIKNRRGIIILLETKFGYELLDKNYDCFSSEVWAEGKDGNLVIHYSHGKYGFWEYIFRYEKDGFELINYNEKGKNIPIKKTVKLSEIKDFDTFWHTKEREKIK